MNQTPNSDDQTLIEVQQLLKEVTESTESLDIDLFEPVREANVLVEQAEIEFSGKESDLIDINETYLEANERAVAEASVKAQAMLAEDDEKSED